MSRAIPEGVKRAAVIGGGLGVAIAYPQAKALHEAGCEVDLIVGFRNEHLIILKDELAAACTDLTIMTDDGSNGNKGFVTQALQAKLDAGKAYDEVIAIGPLPMMKAVCDLTKPKDIKTIVSMNPIMIDGTGMCGGCRVTVGGVTKFACVDGPDFDGHQVDWAEAISRSRHVPPGRAAGDGKAPQVPPDGRCSIMPNMSLQKHPMPEQQPDIRATNFKEVALGYTREIAMEEAEPLPALQECALRQGLPGECADSGLHRAYQEGRVPRSG